MEQKTFTAKYISALKPKSAAYKVTEKSTRGTGRLMLKVLPTGAKEFYFRSRSDGADRMLHIGLYSESGRGGITLAEARRTFDEYSRLAMQVGDVKTHLAKEAQERREAERRKLEQGSFGQLLDAYVRALRADGKASAAQVESLFERNVPIQLRERRANAITTAEVQGILSVLVDRGVQREVNKLRSYLRAAFAFGGKHDYDPRRLAADGVRFHLAANPVALIPRIAEYEKVGERWLRPHELRAFWMALDDTPLVTRAFLRALLALAGQRSTQFLAATWPDYDFDQRLVLLRDRKGRGPMREHLVPLSDLAMEQMELMRQLNGGARVPFTTDGRATLRLETVSKAVRAVSDRLTEREGYARFRLGDLRRTCETLLAEGGLDRETRAHLLSHGRTPGVQGRHYDRYSYLVEKRDASANWERRLRSIIDGGQVIVGRFAAGGQ